MFLAFDCKDLLTSVSVSQHCAWLDHTNYTYVLRFGAVIPGRVAHSEKRFATPHKDIVKKPSPRKRRSCFCCIGRKHLFIPKTLNSLRGQGHLHRFLPALSNKRNRNRLRDLGFVCMFPPAHCLTQPKDLNAVFKIAYVAKGFCVGSLLLHLAPCFNFGGHIHISLT